MKKIILVIALFLINPFYAVGAENDASLLKAKLAKFNQINATFSQVVTNPEGDVLNKSQGELTISRPGKFHWEVLSPEEQLIVSDGTTMWLYDPFIEQVTLINLSDAVQGTPFALLAGAQEQWGKYQIARDHNRFMVKSLDAQEKNSFVFEFDDNDSISRFVVIEEQGQRSEFTLVQKPLKKIESGYFTFQIPAGVEIDDQR